MSTNSIYDDIPDRELTLRLERAPRSEFEPLRASLKRRAHEAQLVWLRATGGLDYNHITFADVRKHNGRSDIAYNLELNRSDPHWCVFHRIPAL